eukprot:TRINITY_DN332_c0_g3_i1.p1 TRINITY_DN332_c0_g3~~TRINITY_DN332_c0_g3_i1.p1  ORF type:complete len:485 (+),score=111.10 TRINITY_DN332_c0_g3_i1:165-1619(+)
MDIGSGEVQYGNGAQAIRINKDGSGFLYYPSGRVAVSFTVSGGGLITQFYDDEDVSKSLQRKNYTSHPLAKGAVYGQGFATTHTGVHLGLIDQCGCGVVTGPGQSCKLVLTKEGGKWEHGSELVQWKYLGKTLPTRLEMPINHSIVLSIQKIPSDLELVFQNQGVSASFPVGRRRKPKVTSSSSRSIVSKSSITTKPLLSSQKSMGETKGGSASASTIKGLESIFEFAESLKKDIAHGKFGSTSYIEKEDVKMRTQKYEKDVLDGTLQSTMSSMSMPMSMSMPSGARRKDGLLASGELPVSPALRKNSGKYREPTILRSKSRKRKLPILSAAKFDEFLKEKADPNVLVAVCFIGSWIPKAGYIERTLEEVNGRLIDEGKTQYKMMKHDVSETKKLRERYRIISLPCYMFFYGGKLVYASNTLGECETDPKTIEKQLELSLKAAQLGRFLPDTFQFSPEKDDLHDGVAKKLDDLQRKLQTMRYGR